MVVHPLAQRSERDRAHGNSLLTRVMTGTESESSESTFLWQSKWSLHDCHARLLEMGYGVKLFCIFFIYFFYCFRSFAVKLDNMEFEVAEM